jgi:hypothetical protein
MYKNCTNTCVVLIHPILLNQAMQAESEVFASSDDEAPFGVINVRGEVPLSPVLPEDGSAVITEHVTPSQAFEVFAGRVFQSQPFASTSHIRGKTGISGIGSDGGSNLVGFGPYAASSEMPPLAPPGNVVGPKDPVSRYFRLKAELEDFEADLDYLVIGGGGGGNSGTGGGVTGEVDSAPAAGASEVLKHMRQEVGQMRARLASAAAVGPLRSLLDDEEAGGGGVVGGSSGGSVSADFGPGLEGGGAFAAGSHDALLRAIASLTSGPTSASAEEDAPSAVEAGAAASSPDPAAVAPADAAEPPSGQPAATYELFYRPNRGGEAAAQRLEKLQVSPTESWTKNGSFVG